MERAFLLPGELKFTRKPMLLSTLLGSCVGVCLFDKKNGWGGLNHYMLPEMGVGNLENGKYGDFAINALIEIAERSASLRRDLVASIYGGGAVTGHLGAMERTQGLDVGQQNIKIARILLRAAEIPILREDTGDNEGRRITMQSDTNAIEVRRIEKSEDVAALEEKRKAFKHRKIRVLIIDDSQVVRGLLRAGIEAAPDMEVAGEAADAYEAREQILASDPDVLCLDIIMPRMNGNDFLKRIMKYKPIPTVIVSTIAKEGSAMRRNVLASGAVGVVDKEDLEIYKGMEILQRVLIPVLRKAAATVVKPIQ